MTIIYISYVTLSLIISFLIASIANKTISRTLLFSFFISLFLTFWFKSPGDNTVSPFLSILLLENTILENNGLIRIIRPFGLFFFVSSIISFLILRKISKT